MKSFFPPLVFWLVGICLLQGTIVSAGQPPKSPPQPQKKLPMAGEVFTVADHIAFLIPAKTDSNTKGKPWVWYAPTLPNLPGPEERWMFEKFQDAGISIAGVDAGESFGSPNGNQVFNALYQEMTKRGFSSKPIMLGRSRGGLMTLSWAAANPEKVGGFAGIYPVCNLSSYPTVARAAGAYGLKPEELQSRLKEFNPIDRLAGLAKAKVPLFAIHGDVDTVVPLEANSGLMKDRYAALGGSMELVIPKNQGHNMWVGFFQCQELVDFVKAQAGRSLTLSAPLPNQVIQRSSKTQGFLPIQGSLTGPSASLATIEARVITNGTAGSWQNLATTLNQSTFSSKLEVPAGGWYRLEVRALKGEVVISEAAVEKVGVGDVFVIAGQSNSANHGEEKLQTQSGMVMAFDGSRWQSANDPQPGASGNAGSFLPPFGDAVVKATNMPVGLVSCGVGATSVREWLPKGTRFPNPPTLEGNVTRLDNGQWESKGTIFDSFVRRMKTLGPNGFRAVLWHQGESDANQKDQTRTLPGKLYREYLETLIRESRREIGWNAPWFVAQASYHVPGDESSPDIREAQASLWKDRIALPGPDTDLLKGDLRDSGGKGVHFSRKGQIEHGIRWAQQVLLWMEKENR